jgi:hypothetical protein
VGLRVEVDVEAGWRSSQGASCTAVKLKTEYVSVWFSVPLKGPLVIDKVHDHLAFTDRRLVSSLGESACMGPRREASPDVHAPVLASSLDSPLRSGWVSRL